MREAWFAANIKCSWTLNLAKGAELKVSWVENTALQVGDRAPDFALFNQDRAR